MRLLRFFRLLLLTGFFANLIIVVIYYKDFSQPGQSWKKAGRLLTNYGNDLQIYFAHADSWNYIALMTFISLLFLLFVVSNAFLKRFLFATVSKKFRPFSFSYGGFMWGFHKLLTSLLTIIFLVGLTNAIIFLHSYPKISTQVDQIHQPATVLLLGTSKRLGATGQRNLYYTYRIEALVDLYNAGKVSRIIISGDNSRHTYNEPANMMLDLMQAGVKEEIIELDYAGFRTLDSMVRLRWHFEVDKVLIISQRFHLERALFLAWFYDIEAMGYTAQGNMSADMLKRELLAKPKALMDVFLFNMQPKFGRTPERVQYDYRSKKGSLLLIGISLLLMSSAGLMGYSLKR